MGFEYALRFRYADATGLRELLRTIANVRERPDGSLELRTDHGPGAWPDATVWIHPWGVLFCDHGNVRGQAALGFVVETLASSFGPIKIDEN